MFETLFTPIKIRDMELRNRVVLPAMGTRMASIDGEITDKLIHYHEARANGGCGLNIVEVSAVHSPSAPGFFVSIAEDAMIAGHKKLTDAIHRADGKAGIQLWQGSIAAVMDAKGSAELLVVSDMDFAGKQLKAITKEKICEIIQCYADAARRCVEAGYDCIEFHCAHNYLPHSFLSGGINHRTDEYGGSFENRCRFPLEVIRTIREVIPEGMPLLMRIGAHDDNLEGGMTIEEVISFCKKAGEAGVDVLDVSRGNIITEASAYEVPPIDIERGFNVENAARIKKETGMITIAVGRINHAEQAETILASDQADLVVMGRAQLADAEFCNKAKTGRVEDIVHCVGCNQGCYDGFCDMAHFPHITCMRNPQLGREGEDLLKKTEAPKRVWIVGGGMGGMEAALILKQRGHRPEIFESSKQMGGQFIIAGLAPGKEEMKEAALSMGKQVIAAGITVHFETTLTPEQIKNEKPDAVIAAIGASPIQPAIPGIDRKKVWLANDVLEQKGKLEGTVCIIGGGLVGLETADLLAGSGCHVTVVEMKDAIGEDLGVLRKIMVMQKLYGLKVNMLTKAVCQEITEDGVTIKIGDEIKDISCDYVVLAAGSKEKDTKAMKEACEELVIPYAVIGDAKQARRALNAIAEGFEAAITIQYTGGFTMKSKLFEQLSIGSMTMKNTTFMAPMSLGYESEDGTINETLQEYWLARARGGVGCIITDALSVDPNVPYLGNTLCFRSDESIVSYAAFVEKIHKEGAKIIPQITHPGPESISAFFGIAPIASSVYLNSMGQKTRELSLQEIPGIIKQYANAALNAKKAGFDGIELHCAHAYMLLGSFLSPMRNKRTDIYGGSLDNRVRLLLEVLDAIKEACGKTFPVILRMSGSERNEQGNTLADMKYLIPILERHGVDAFEISGGTQYEACHKIIACHGEQRGVNVEEAAAIKRAASVPVIVVGKINEVKYAQYIVDSEKADGIVIGRALLADAEFVKKAEEGRITEIAPCTTCAIGCVGEQTKRNPASCVINPALGKEMDMVLQKQENGKKIAVVGGGIAGAAAARAFALCGHKVTLYEKDNVLGGQMRLACVPPHKQEISKWMIYLTNELYRLDVNIQLGIMADANLLKQEDYEIVVLATGATSVIPPVEGVERETAVSAWQVISQEIPVLAGNILVVGGGMVGCEVCELIMHQARGPVSITMIEMMDEIGAGMVVNNKLPMMKRLTSLGVCMLPKTKLVSVTPHSAIIESGGKQTELTDLTQIVYACGSKAEQSLHKEIKEHFQKVYCIGDCQSPAQALEAVRSAWAAAIDAGK